MVGCTGRSCAQHRKQEPLEQSSSTTGRPHKVGIGNDLCRQGLRSIRQAWSFNQDRPAQDPQAGSAQRDGAALGTAGHNQA